MMCYRDMTFCIAACANTECSRMLTDKVRQDAERWWGNAGAPIAVSDFSEGCEEYLVIKELK